MWMTERRFDRRLAHCLHKKMDQLHNPESKEAVGKILDSASRYRKLVGELYPMMKSAGVFVNLPENIVAFGAEGDRPILEAIFKFIQSHWDEILALILKLIGGL